MKNTVNKRNNKVVKISLMLIFSLIFSIISEAASTRLLTLTNIDCDNGAESPIYFVKALDNVDYSKAVKIEATVTVTGSYANGTIGADTFDKKGNQVWTQGDWEISSAGKFVCTLDNLNGVAPRLNPNNSKDKNLYVAEIQFWWVNDGKIDLQNIKLYDKNGKVIQNNSQTTAMTAATKKDISSCVISVVKTKTYTGSKIKPSALIKDGSKTLVKGTDYTLSYKNNLQPGKATVVVKGKGNYSGTVNKTFTITPRAPTGITINSNASGQLVIYFDGDDDDKSGYEIYTSLSKDGTYTLNGTTTSNQYTTINLKAGTKYYVKVRAYYENADSKLYYSSYSIIYSRTTEKASSSSKSSTTSNSTDTSKTTEKKTYTSKDKRFTTDVGYADIYLNGEQLRGQVLFDIFSWGSDHYDNFIIKDFSGNYKISFRWNKDYLISGSKYNYADFSAKKNGEYATIWGVRTPSSYTYDNIQTVSYMGGKYFTDLWVNIEGFDKDGVTTATFYIETNDGNGGTTTFEGFFAVKFQAPIEKDTSTSNTSDTSQSSSNSSSTSTGSSTNVPIIRQTCGTCHGSKICQVCFGRGGISTPTYGMGGSGWTVCKGCNGSRRCWSCS